MIAKTRNVGDVALVLGLAAALLTRVLGYPSVGRRHSTDARFDLVVVLRYGW